MARTLELEFTYTKADIRAAEELCVRQQLGRGSKFQTRLVLFVMFAFVIGLAVMQFKFAKDTFQRYLLIGLIPVAYVWVTWRRRTRERQFDPPAMRVQITEHEINVTGSGAASALWSSFGKAYESETLFVLFEATGAPFIIPKRAFANADDIAWFRTLMPTSKSANNPLAPQGREPMPAPSLIPPADGVTIHFQLTLRDYIDRALAAWSLRAAILAFAVFETGIFIYVGANPPPDAVYTLKQVYVMAGIPMMLIMSVVMFGIWSVKPWLMHKSLLVPTDLTLANDGIWSVDKNGTTRMPWSTYDRYKQTRRSIFLWQGRLWMQIPKRAFSNDTDLHRATTLIAKHTKRSTWFWGY